jgi:AraC-like DNA-binding protein
MTIIKMDPAEYAISAEYFPLLLDILKRRSITEEQLLEPLPLEPGFWREPGQRIPLPEFEQIGRRVFELTGEPWLGWEFGAGMTISSHGFLGYAAMSSETLGDAIELAVRFFRTRTTIVELQHRIEGDTSVLQIDELVSLNELAPFIVEALFSSFHFIGQKLVPDLVPDGELRFAYPEPAYFHRMRDLIPVPCRFDCAHHQMRFPVQQLEEKLRFADPRLASMAEAQCEQELASIKSPPRLLGQVRRIILGRSGEFPDVDEVAEELYMSSRTLKRKLQQLGTSYQRVLDELRKGLAVEYLSQSDKTVDEIALSLGYSDASNFARAFRRWTGRSPSDYRS